MNNKFSLLFTLLIIFSFFGCGNNTVNSVKSSQEESNLSNFEKETYNTFHTGFGGASSFKFMDERNSSQFIWVSSYDLIFDTNFSDNDYYKNIKDYNASAFESVQKHLQNTHYLTLWLTKDWQESWFDVKAINEGIKKGVIPVFIYWYFGDTLVNALPNSTEVDDYKKDNLKLKAFLDKIQGNKLLIMEPEFNKQSVLDNSQDFVSIISDAIDRVDSNDTLISLCMTDTGNRGVNETWAKCGYENCSLGDKFEFNSTKPIYDALLDKLDFISFQEMLGQFSRDPQNPGDWNHPNPKAYTDDEIGINTLSKRIENFSSYLYQLYKKPIYLPYIAIASATWSDENNDNIIQNSEINESGFEPEIEKFYSELNNTKLLQNHLFGYSVMELFDNPQHDAGGYQFFMQNEYHLGIIKSSSKSGIDQAISGDIHQKASLLDTIFSK